MKSDKNDTLTIPAEPFKVFFKVFIGVVFIVTLYYLSLFVYGLFALRTLPLQEGVRVYQLIFFSWLAFISWLTYRLWAK